MARQDLLALTPDDLVTLTNRGIVRRATQEAEGSEVTAGIIEDGDGTVTAQWSDDVECKLPGGETLSAASCSCPATTLCRHIIRTVLAYQQWATQQLDAGAAGQQLHGLRIFTGRLKHHINLPIDQRIGGRDAGGAVKLNVRRPHTRVLQHQPGCNEGR